MNRSVLLNNINLRENFDIVMTSKKIATAEIKKESIEIPGMHGAIDMSTALTGDVCYKNRIITINLIKCSENGDLLPFQSEFDSLFSGKEVVCVFEEDPLYYWTGRAQVEHKIDRMIDSITVEIEVYPFKYKKDITVIENTIVNTKIILCNNSRKYVVPKFKATSDMTILFNGNSYAIGTNETIIANIVFKHGENKIIVTGNGELTIKYQEGAL